jgi:hypothetical protein
MVNDSLHIKPLYGLIFMIVLLRTVKLVESRELRVWSRSKVNYDCVDDSLFLL